jgi:hypothetical protein
MDKRERLNNPTAAMRAAFAGLESNLWTAIPAILQSFNAAKVTCVAQPAIQVQFRSSTGTWSNQTLPLCTDCPVILPGGGGFFASFPLTKGDEGVLVFASRCIDAWWQSGGVQPQAELRMHDLADGFFLPCVFSQPRLPAGVISTSAAQLRSLDGHTYVEVGAGELKLTCDNGQTDLEMTAGQTIFRIGGVAVMTVSSSGVTVNGNLSSVGGSTTIDGITFGTHKHTGVQTGGGTSGGPTN